MKILGIVQARMGSTRLPDKVMRPIHGVPMIELLIRRLARSRRLDGIILATSIDPRNEPLADHVRGMGYEVFQGSETDVLDRYYQAARPHRPDAVVRITGDCPLIDPELVDLVIGCYEAEHADYATNTMPPTYPDGLDTEVFAFAALEAAMARASTPEQREHVTPFIRESPAFRRVNVASKVDYSGLRWTVDEAADVGVVSAVFDHFWPRLDFGWQEVVQIQETRPECFVSNRHIPRNEGMILSVEQKVRKRTQADSL